MPVAGRHPAVCSIQPVKPADKVLPKDKAEA
ncbi:hypothetical protein COLO4_02063 [Corchorus olitorius]|uniref:Uncharacterized protein n=1 Tax=Corchorus olitorius TaxID=93759 RepID=A0A1R3L1P9_9ROSI|nr:hypothetical protein COLO4_02063 [Corchorus olitorius]